TIDDGDVISLIRKFLVSGVQIDEEYKETVIGTPQGGNLSPLLSNIMLNELDRELENRGLQFVRYADDCIIMVKSEMSAKRVMRSVSRFIEEKLGLIVNVEKSRVTKPSDPDMKFLGFGFFKDYRADLYKARPHQKSLESFKFKLKLRMCIWKKWKTAKNRKKNLIKLGMDKYNAYKNSHTSKGAARIANSWVLSTTITNKRLAQFGLLSSRQHYMKVHV
ncbi:reverse transcriptase domain-containing protein, partial [Robertmurraya sp. DFI.2.37]|uniref:reverse transcriptase domain-containing protein n=2 Tax=Robertmurraya sp. DFI.2.37 TaxID=3031819 RepID=UPI0023D9B827